MKILKNPKLMMIIAMTTFGTIPVFKAMINLSAGELSLYRGLLAIIFLCGFFLVTKQSIKVKEIKKDIVFLALSGIAMGINWILLFEAYNYTTASNATLSYYFAPIIVTIVSPFLFKEKMTIKKIICFVMSTVGLILITDLTNLKDGSNNIKGILFGLSAAVFYATVIILNKYIKGVSGINRTFYQFIAAVIILIPYVLLTTGINLGDLKPIGWGSLLALGLVHTGVCYCLYFSSLKELKGQEAAILSYIDPLVAVFCSLVFLNEGMQWFQYIGGALILGFNIWNEVSFKKKVIYGNN